MKTYLERIAIIHGYVRPGQVPPRQGHPGGVPPCDGERPGARADRPVNREAPLDENGNPPSAPVVFAMVQDPVMA